MSERILAAAITALLVAAAPGVPAVEKPPRSKVLPQVRVLWIDARGCTPQLAADLQGIGYALATARDHAQGVLSVHMRYMQTDAGAETARYAATLRDRQGGIIRQTSGRGESPSRQGLCGIVSRQIADYLEDRMEVIG